YGTLEKQTKIYMIISWCEHGNLEEYIKNNQDLDWTIKLKIATGIANGLVFCHHRDILHHDVRSYNILLDANICAKLSGFHLSRKEENETTSINQIETKWIAPEKLVDRNTPYTRECDIYSFAIVLWEIAVQKTPYYELKDLKDPVAFAKHVSDGNRPELVDESIIPHNYTKIMKDAWRTEPNKRPSAEIMHKKLATCLEDDCLTTPLNTEFNSSFSVASCIPASSENPLLLENLPPFEHNDFSAAINFHKEKQYQYALPIFQQLASEGHAKATYYLAYYYHRGYIVKKDKIKAHKYYQKSAELGCYDAEYDYAYMGRAAKHGYIKAGVKFVELQLSEISWLLARKHNKSELLEYLKREESLVANCKIEIKKELEKKINKLQEIIQSK
ncbi:19394_t:CDS:2, partial [Gigaspora margarita]